MAAEQLNIMENIGYFTQLIKEANKQLGINEDPKKYWKWLQEYLALFKQHGLPQHNQPYFRDELQKTLGFVPFQQLVETMSIGVNSRYIVASNADFSSNSGDYCVVSFGVGCIRSINQVDLSGMGRGVILFQMFRPVLGTNITPIIINNSQIEPQRIYPESRFIFPLP